MFEQKKLTALSLAVLLALLMAAILPISALAQDGAPPQPDAPMVEDPVVDEPVVEEPTALEPTAEEPAVEEVTVAEVLAEIPENIEVVALDENGEALPLASMEAAEVVLTSDPMWCPVTATTVTSACLNDATVTGLLIKINNMTEAGVIYFMPTYTGSDASFDGAALGTTANYDITFQGGWDGTTTLNSAISFNNTTTFNNPFAVYSWNANVTVNNFTVTGVNTTANQALYVGTTKDVVLNNVDVSYNVIDTDATASYGTGATVYTSGNVTVNNSRFNGNENGGKPGVLAGLWIGHLGNVTLNNVTANYNKGDGTDIWAVKNVNVSNSNFNFNTPNVSSFSGDPWGNGLWIDEIKGDVTLNNVTATGNSYNGVEVGSRSNEGKLGNGTKGNISVNGGYFENNGYGASGGDGLHLSADGNITLNGVYASGNYDDGAEVCAGGDVNLNGNTFYYNSYGVYLRCAKNVNSNYNYWWNSWYSSYWDNWYGYYYGTGDYYYSGYYNGFYYNGWALPTWGGPYVTINNIYVDGYFLPHYNAYYSFYNSYYYGHGWHGWRDYIDRGPGWRWWGWNWGWLYRGYPFQGVVTTKPMTAELTPLTEDELPGKLPGDKTFADAFKAEVSDGVPGEVTQVSFEVPAGFADGDTLTVLSWNDSDWEEVPATIEDGRVKFKVGESGIFALVTP